MKEQQCKLCGSAVRDVLLTGQALDRLEGPAYRYLRCASCGLVVLEGVFETRGNDYEESGYYSTRRTLLAPILDKALQFIEYARLGTVARLAPHLPPGRVLDIGSGKARFLRCVRARGWDAVGLEPVRRDRGTEEGEQELPIVREYLRPDLWEDEQFDLITLWHVLEHLPDPLWAMRIAYQWLGVDGAVALAMPNLNSWQAEIGGSVWFHLDPPRHLHHFSPPTLKKLLEEVGFVEVQVVFPILGLGYLGMVQTVLNRLGFTPNLLYNLLKRNRAGLPQQEGRLVVEAILCVLTLTLIWLPLAILTVTESLSGHGGTMIAVARKR